MPVKHRVLVTGASGLVASGVIPELLQAGYDVVGLSRRDRSVAYGGIPWIRADLAGEFEPELDKYCPIYSVVHLAAAITSSPASELQKLRALNMEASERLFRYCGENTIPKVVFVSSLGILARPLRCPITEQHPVGPVLPYHVSKYWGELALREAADRHGFIGVSLRISSPITRNFDLLPSTVVRNWMMLAGQGKPIGIWGRGSRTQDFVAVEDIGQAVVRVLERIDKFDLIHIAAGRETSMWELAEAVASLSETSVDITKPSDPNEDERWAIDLSYSRKVLGYEPRFTIFDHLPALREQMTCVVQ